MPTVYLAPADYKAAQVDLWQQAALKRINDTYAPPPAQPAAPAQPTPEATAGPGQPAAPPAAAAVSSTPPAASPPSTQTAPAAAVSPPTSAPANPSSVDDWVRNKTVDLWQQGVNSQLANGVGPVVDAINQTLSGVPQQAQNWARGVVGLPQTTSGSTTPAASPGAISGASSAPTTPTPVASGGTDYESQARAAAQKYNIDPDIFVRQLNQESGLQPFNPDGSVKTSPAGARGIAQFMPATAQGMGINPDDPGQAIDAAARMDAQNLQKYGGDWSKTLAAYNAGPGNVDKYGGIPPFEETQRYVANILGAGPQAATGNASQQVPTASTAGPSSLDRTSQFQLGLSSADAMAACGPAAAIAFARLYGRNPTAQEAMQLAAQSGWTQAGGMNGVVNEKKLLDALQVPNKLETGAVDWAKVTSEVNNGNPVIVSTPGHYFTVDQAKPAQGGDQMLYHVGTSGTDLRQGAEWMTQTQIEHLEGQANGALYADNPQAQGPSLTEQVSQTASNVSSAVQSRANDILGFVQNLSNGAPQAAQNAGDFLANYGPPALQNKALSAMGQGITNVAQDIASQPQQNPIAQTLGAIGQAAPNPVDKAVFGAVANFPLVNQPSVLDNMQTMQELTQKYPSANGGLLPDVNAMTPEDRQAYSHAMLAVGGLLGGEGMPAESTAGSAGGADALAAARQAVQDMANRFPQMSPGSLAASGAGKQLAALETDAALHPENYVDLAQPETTRLEPEIQGALDAAKPPPQPASDVVTGLQNMVNGRNGTPSQSPVDVNGLTQRLQNLTQQVNNAPPIKPVLPTDVGNGATSGMVRPTAQQWAGMTHDQRMQYLQGGGMPVVGGPRPPGSEALPGGPMPGQFGMFDQSLPLGGPRPTGNEAMGPSGGQPGQLQFGSELPVGGPRPTGTEALAQGAQPGQLQFGSELPLGGPAPTGTEAQGAAGPLKGQMRLPGFPNPQTASPLQLFNAYHTGNVISSPATTVHVIVNSIISPVWSLATRTGADLLGGRLDRVAGRGVGTVSALANVGSDLANGLHDFYSDPANIANRVDNSLVSNFFRVQQGTGAALHAGFQNMAQQAMTRMELGAQAGEQAWAQGLRGQDYLNGIGDLMANPTAAMLARAQDVGTRGALRGAPGAIQSTFQQIQRVPLIGNTLFPVVRIASQSLAQGIEKSPVGLLGTGLDVAKAAIGKGPYAEGFNQTGGAVTPLTDRLTNNIAGTALTLWLISKAQDGTITGNGPSDPQARATLQSQGWQPYSLYVPGRGYMDYRFMGPQAVAMALAGAWHDAATYGNPNPQTTQTERYGQPLAAQPSDTDRAAEFAKQLLIQVGTYLVNHTGLSTLSDVAGAIKGDPAALASWPGSVASGFVPFSALVRGGVSAADPFQRKVEPGAIMQIVQEGLPGGLPIIGGRTDLPVSQNVLGQPKQNPQAGLGVLTPRTGAGQANPVLETLSNAGINLPSNSPTTIAYAGRAFPLTPQEQLQRQQLEGQRLTQAITPLTQSVRFQAMPPQQQYRVLQPIVSAASQYANAKLLASIPVQERQQRLAVASTAYGAGGLTREYGAGALPYLGGPSVAMQQAQAAEAQAQQRHAALQQSLTTPAAAPSAQAVAP